MYNLYISIYIRVCLLLTAFYCMSNTQLLRKCDIFAFFSSKIKFLLVLYIIIDSYIYAPSPQSSSAVYCRETIDHWSTLGIVKCGMLPRRETCYIFLFLLMLRALLRILDAIIRMLSVFFEQFLKTLLAGIAEYAQILNFLSS